MNRVCGLIPYWLLLYLASTFTRQYNRVTGSHLDALGSQPALMLVCQQDISQLGFRVQKLLGIKHELSDIWDVANAVFHRCHVNNPRGF